MKLGINWSQASTQRGLIWVLTAIAGAVAPKVAQITVATTHDELDALM